MGVYFWFVARDRCRPLNRSRRDRSRRASKHGTPRRVTANRDRAWSATRSLLAVDEGRPSRPRVPPPSRPRSRAVRGFGTRNHHDAALPRLVRGVRAGRGRRAGDRGRAVPGADRRAPPGARASRHVDQRARRRQVREPAPARRAALQARGGRRAVGRGRAVQRRHLRRRAPAASERHLRQHLHQGERDGGRRHALAHAAGQVLRAEVRHERPP
jgi:hypothetical protein